MNSEPYSYQIGGSLDVNHPTYVIRQADFDLYNSLKTGDFCYVLNSRQMGKSSLRVRTMQQLIAEKFACASIDISSIIRDDITPEQWYKGLISELLRSFQLFGQFNLTQWWREREGISAVQRFNWFLEDVLLTQIINQPIVLFIDEIDSILNLKFPIDDFFALIRFCYNQRAENYTYKRLTFALFGVATPSDLMKDKTRTPFNIGKAIELKGLALESAQPLATGLVRNADNPQAVLREILNWTGGQPFLTQKLCKLIISNHSIIPENRETEVIENLVQRQVIDNWEAQDEPVHLQTIRDRILNNERRAIQLLNLYKPILQYGEIPTTNNYDEVELRLSGLVVKEGKILKVYNRIYQQVFDLDWLEKQLASLWLFLQDSGDIDNVIFLSPSLKGLSNVLWFCGSFLTISALSLFSCYHWFSSIPWQREFGADGAIIEFSRSVILAIGTVCFIGMVWKKEALELVQSSQLPIKRWRLGILMVGILVFFLSLYYHAIAAPLHLKEIAIEKQYPNQYGEFRAYFLPYLLYFPYTLINYNILALGWVSISIYGAIKDLSKNFLRTQYLQKRLEDIESYFQYKSFIEKNLIEEMVEREFIKFSLNFITMVSRYTILCLSIAVIVLFEYNWGLKTLSDTAQQLMIFTYVFNAFALIMVLWGFSHYHTAFRKASICLFNLQCAHAKFEAKHNIIQLLKKIINSHFNLYLLIAIVVIYFLLAAISTFIL
jgi:hypothetical protein